MAAGLRFGDEYLKTFNGSKRFKINVLIHSVEDKERTLVLKAVKQRANNGANIGRFNMLCLYSTPTDSFDHPQ